MLRIVNAQTKTIKIMVIQGSARNVSNCPGQYGKTRTLLRKAVASLPSHVQVDHLDLSVNEDQSIVQPCKACVSTAGGFHCHWPCDCYSPNDKDRPDFMHDNDVYARLEKADGFILFAPINWYSVPTVVKSMFDRLVCANLTITDKQAKDLMDGEIKNPTKSRALEKGGNHDHLLKNHLQGKFAAFFIHGDDGGTDYREKCEVTTDKPSFPKSYTLPVMKSRDEHGFEGITNSAEQAVMPLVWQCRYSGIFVPDDLIIGIHINKSVGYAEANDAVKQNDKFFKKGESLINRLVKHIKDNR